MALISFFVSKKSGMKDSSAAMTAAAAGLGSYYVATETDWGKSASSWLGEKWDVLMDGGESVKNADGTVVTAPPGATVEKNPDGTVKTDAEGNVLWKLIDTTGKAVATTGSVLESWGPTGTAAVVGTTAVATDSTLKKYLPWLGLGLVAILLVR